MKRDLQKLGCTSRKSLSLNFPTNLMVPNELMKFFILGYFDGDGSLWISKNGKCAQFKIISSTKFCNGLCSYFNTIGIYSKVWHDTHHKMETSYLRINRRSEIYSYLNNVYDGATFFLKRKYMKFQQLKSLLK